MVSSLNVLGYAILLILVWFTDTSVSFYHLVNINCQVKDIANGKRLVKSLLLQLLAKYPEAMYQYD